MRELLMLRQQSPQGDTYMKYSLDIHGLKNNQTQDFEPFYILCDHNSVMDTRNGSTICAKCGWFIKKTDADQKILEKQCTHPDNYAIINFIKKIKKCGQCGTESNCLIQSFGLR
jgi:hypothetical protein